MRLISRLDLKLDIQLLCVLVAGEVGADFGLPVAMVVHQPDDALHALLELGLVEGGAKFKAAHVDRLDIAGSALGQSAGRDEAIEVIEAGVEFECDGARGQHAGRGFNLLESAALI